MTLFLERTFRLSPAPCLCHDDHDPVLFSKNSYWLGALLCSPWTGLSAKEAEVEDVIAGWLVTGSCCRAGTVFRFRTLGLSVLRPSECLATMLGWPTPVEVGNSAQWVRRTRTCFSFGKLVFCNFGTGWGGEEGCTCVMTYGDLRTTCGSQFWDWIQVLRLGNKHIYTHWAISLAQENLLYGHFPASEDHSRGNREGGTHIEIWELNQVLTVLWLCTRPRARPLLSSS